MQITVEYLPVVEPSTVPPKPIAYRTSKLTENIYSVGLYFSYYCNTQHFKLIINYKN